MRRKELPDVTASSDQTTASFIGKVHQLLGTLPPSEYRLGEFVLNFPGDLASYTASELAAMVGVSNATVTRFIRRLGYDSYDDARKHAREATKEGSALFLNHAQKSSSESQAFNAQIQQIHTNISRTFEHISAHIIQSVIQAMVTAKRVYFLGTRNNHNLASYLRWQVLQSIAHTELIPGPGETLGEYAASLTSEDLLIVFDFRRSMPVVRRFTELAHHAGIPVVYITDHHSPEVLPARWLLRCETEATGPLDNHAAAITLCHLLATGVVQQSSQPGKHRLAAVEAAHDKLAEL